MGLRFSGKNMSPLPGWMSGGQFVALNMSNCDLPVHLHFALFNRSTGFVLKPREMRAGADESGNASRGGQSDEVYWPPPRDKLHCVSVNIHSLHNLPQGGEQRPRYSGSCSACHQYHPELSGRAVAPRSVHSSSPSIKVSIHSIGGFCAVSSSLPLREDASADICSARVKKNGMNATFEQTIHCVAAEPSATFLRTSVVDQGREVAYEVAVLGRLRRGCRVLLLRSSLGTRIEFCYLLVSITFSSEPNHFPTLRQLRIKSAELTKSSSNWSRLPLASEEHSTSTYGIHADKAEYGIAGAELPAGTQREWHHSRVSERG